MARKEDFGTSSSDAVERATVIRAGEQAAKEIFTCLRCQATYTVESKVDECPVCFWGRPKSVPAMRFAYADPPYLGCGKLYAAHHPGALDWDRPKTHRKLIERLCDEYPDGWVMSLSSPSLRTLLPMCPDDVRLGSWVKPFAVFKPNVNPAYAFEPVIFRGGRKFTRADDTVRDWVSANITLKRGLTGAKPRDFCLWVIALMNALPGDQFDDLFPGTGAFTAAWHEIQNVAPPFQMQITSDAAPLRSEE